MTATDDLTTEQGLSTYLTSQSIPYTSVALLTGGTANYVYRVTHPTNTTTIYKHAAPYLHSNTNFPFDPSRMDYEHRVLRILPPLLKTQLPNSNVHAAGCYSYDRERKLLCLEDGGENNLKTTYTDPQLDVVQIGQELGHWIAAVHMCTPQTSLSLSPGDADLKANNAVGVSIYRHSYENLATAFAQYRGNHEIELAIHINDAYGSRLATDNECICHGDFWPGNVLVKPSTSSAPKLTTVDWEMTRQGTSATDVAQFCAEAFLLDRFRGGRGLLPSFLNAYFAARQGKTRSGLGKEWVRRVAVHWGVHVAFWPTRVEWTDKEGTKRLVDIGESILRAAVEGNWEKLYTSELFLGLEERFREI